jgi:hypothetical protein
MYQFLCPKVRFVIIVIAIRMILLSLDIVIFYYLDSAQLACALTFRCFYEVAKFKTNNSNTNVNSLNL